MLISPGSPAAFPENQGVRPLALRHTLPDALPFSSFSNFLSKNYAVK
jgi:hypothetical protein